MTVIVSVVLILQVLGILSAIHAVMNVRTPQGSIAWAVSLVIMPAVGVPAYWVFGRNKFNGYVLARRADDDRLDDLSRRARLGIERLDAGSEWGNTVVRGVDVRILIPEVSDSFLVKLAAYSYFDEVSSTGVNFYRYQDGFLHGKVMLVDDSAATVGTANFDNRSFRLNFEITVIVAEQAFAQAVAAMFEEDFEHSRRMEKGEYEIRNYLFKVATRVARLASPVL